MTVQFEWTIQAIWAIPEQEGLFNVVRSIDWSILATDPEAGVAKATFGVTDLPAPSQQSFIAFKDLTKDSVESWLTQHNTDVVTAIEEAIKREKQNQTVLKAAPWL